MTSKSNAFRAFGLGLSCSLLAASAHAGTTTVSFSTTVDQLTNFNVTRDLPKFNPALGTLLGATLTVDPAFSSTFSATNNDPVATTINVTLAGTITLGCPTGTGMCSSGTSTIYSANPSQVFPYPLVGTGQTVSGTLALDPPATVFTIGSSPGLNLTLANFTGPGILTFPIGATGMTTFAGPGNVSQSAVTSASVVLTVTYTYDIVVGDCPQVTPDKPGSLLLYPRYDSRPGRLTVITVTNTNCSFMPGAGGLPVGTVDVEFVYIGRYGPDDLDLQCLETNLTRRLSPCDTFTAIAATHNPNAQRGFMYAFAKSPITGQAIVFNHLIGQAIFLTMSAGGDSGDLFGGARDALNARSFLGIGSASGVPQVDGTPTDLANIGVRDLDGREYSPAPDKILIPRFLGQDPTGPGNLFRSTLTLLNLSGGAQFNTIVYFEIFNDYEQMTSGQFSFRCWDEKRLVELDTAGPSFLQSTLAASLNDPLEIIGATMGPNARESGWFTIDGQTANSGVHQVNDPVIYAVLCERVGNYEVCDLPWELCVDPRGDLYETSTVFDEDPPSFP